MIVGSRLRLTVTITDKATGALVDPGALALRLKAPAKSAIPVGTYNWDGAAWAVSESAIATPLKGAVGVFTLTITVPYDNTAAGSWYVGWKHAENGSSQGEGSGDTEFVVFASKVLDA